MRTLSVALFIAAGLLAADAARVSPAFTIERPGAAPLTLAQYRGKVVLAAFIDTNCPHCQALTGVLSAISREYAPKGVQVLECAFNDGAKDKVAEFVRNYNPSFPVGFSERPKVMAYLQYTTTDERPLYVPHLVFLDRRGVIRQDVPGEAPFMQNPEANIRAELDKLLKAGATSRP
jgi:peroxiredoxin